MELVQFVAQLFAYTPFCVEFIVRSWAKVAVQQQGKRERRIVYGNAKETMGLGIEIGNMDTRLLRILFKSFTKRKGGSHLFFRRL